jgi:hypothetical protein
LNESGHTAPEGGIIPANLIPLKDAPWAFASQRLRSEWYRAQEALSPAKMDRLNAEQAELLKRGLSEHLTEAFKLMTESAQVMLEDMRARSAPERAMQESLLEKLRDGKLEAWGVEVAPEHKRGLEMLLPHFFMDAKISWNRNTVISLGVTYGAVQVRHSSATSQVTTEKADVPTSVLIKPTDQDTDETSAALTLPTGQETGEGQRQKSGPRRGLRR